MVATKPFKQPSPDFRWKANLAWRITLRRFNLTTSEIARASGVSQARLSQFLNSKSNLNHVNFANAIAALPDEAKAFYIDRVFWRNTSASTRDESLAMAIADLISYYLNQKGVSLEEFAQEVMLSVDVIEDIFTGAFFVERSEKDIRTAVRLLSSRLINPSTGETFLDSEELFRYCGLMGGEDENGSTHQEQSHCNN